LTKERNILFVGFLALLTAVVLRSLVVEGAIGGNLVLVATIAFVYLVFRLSRFLRQAVWLTALYCVLGLAPFVSAIPFIGLLVAIKNARRGLPSVGRGRVILGVIVEDSAQVMAVRKLMDRFVRKHSAEIEGGADLDHRPDLQMCSVSFAVRGTEKRKLDLEDMCKQELRNAGIPFA
jgi:hypothetical protein